MPWPPLFTKQDQGPWPPKAPEAVSERLCAGNWSSVSWVLFKAEPGRPEIACPDSSQLVGMISTSEAEYLFPCL